MKDIVRTFVNVLGTCVIIASLCSGCASSVMPQGRDVVNLKDLENYRIDCKLKDQQIPFLQSLRRTSDDIFFSSPGWSEYNHHVNWVINSHLIYIKNYC